MQQVHIIVVNHTLLEANFSCRVRRSFVLVSFYFGMKNLSDMTFLEKYKLLYETYDL